MSEIDLNALRQFIGRQEVREDTVRSDAMDQFRGTLEPYLVGAEIAPVPPGFHWTLFAPLTPMGELRADGHPVSDGLLPEMPLPARMWAGGEVTTLRALNPGDSVERRSQIRSIDLKTGRSGPLLFVIIGHEVSRAGELCILEEQTLVYREPAPRSDAAPAGGPPDTGKGDFMADSRLLFRYSALTFNTHRIHYDLPYAREVEAYRDLVVHGPLQATLLMNAVSRRLGDLRFRFSYRGLAPLFAGERANIRVGAGEARIERATGDVTLQAWFSVNT